MLSALIVVGYMFVVQPNQIVGSSMESTFKSGTYVLVDKLSYRFGEPQRGDIVIYSHSDNMFIHRIVGLPNERIRIQNGSVFVNDQALSEPYIAAGALSTGGDFLPDSVEKTIDPGQYFVMGDHRPYTGGSHAWGFVSMDDIVGRVMFCYANCK